MAKKAKHFSEALRQHIEELQAEGELAKGEAGYQPDSEERFVEGSCCTDTGSRLEPRYATATSTPANERPGLVPRITPPPQDVRNAENAERAITAQREAATHECSNLTEEEKRHLQLDAERRAQIERTIREMGGYRRFRKTVPEGLANQFLAKGGTLSGGVPKTPNANDPMLSQRSRNYQVGARTRLMTEG